MRGWFVWAGAVLFVGAWALAIPVASTPDADDHVLYAASLWRGQLTSTDVRVENGPEVAVESVVEVPAAYARLTDRYACFTRDETQRASCQPDPGSDDTLVEARSRAGRYPPAYYLVVGAPTRLADAIDGVLGARMLSALLNGSLLGAAVWLARRWRRDTVLLLAVTPRIGQLSGLLNPSGMELTGSLLLWVGALRVAERLADRRDDTEDPVVEDAAWWAVAVGGAAVALARPLGPILLVSVLVVAAAWVVACRPIRSWPRHSASLRVVPRGVPVVLGGALVVAVAWMVLRDPAGAIAGVPAPQLAAGEIVREMLGRTDEFLRGMVWFGPPEVARLWLALAGVLLGVAVWRGRPRARLAIGLVVAWTVVVPILAVLRTAAETGVIWQGRYAQPVTAGLVVLTSWVLARSLSVRAEAGVRWSVAAGTGVIAVWSVQDQVASRIAFPSEAASWFPAPHPGGWAPPVPAVLVVAVGIAAWVLLAGVRPRPAEDGSVVA